MSWSFDTWEAASAVLADGAPSGGLVLGVLGVLLVLLLVLIAAVVLGVVYVVRRVRRRGE